MLRELFDTKDILARLDMFASKMPPLSQLLATEAHIASKLEEPVWIEIAIYVLVEASVAMALRALRCVNQVFTVHLAHNLENFAHLLIIVR